MTTKKLGFIAAGGLFLTMGSTVALGYGATSPASAPSCTREVLSKPTVYEARMIGSDEVRLSWEKMDKATNWTIAYGVQAGQYIWGLSNFGNSGWNTIGIRYLPAGTYHFVIRANNDCMPGNFSDEKVVSVGQTRTARSVGLVPTTRVPIAPPVYELPKSVPQGSPTLPTAQPTVNQRQPVAPVKAVLPQQPKKTGNFLDSIASFFQKLFSR